MVPSLVWSYVPFERIHLNWGALKIESEKPNKVKICFRSSCDSLISAFHSRIANDDIDEEICIAFGYAQLILIWNCICKSHNRSRTKSKCAQTWSVDSTGKLTEYPIKERRKMISLKITYANVKRYLFSCGFASQNVNDCFLSWKGTKQMCTHSPTVSFRTVFFFFFVMNLSQIFLFGSRIEERIRTWFVLSRSKQ